MAPKFCQALKIKFHKQKKNWCKTQENTYSRYIQPKLGQGQGVKRCLQFCANHEGSKKSQKILISSEKIVLFNWKYYLFCLKFIWKKDLSENKLPPQKILIKNKLYFTTWKLKIQCFYLLILIIWLTIIIWSYIT